MTDEAVHDSAESVKSAESPVNPDSQTTSETSEEVTGSDEEQSEETEEQQNENSEVQEYDEGLKKSRTTFSERFNKFLANFRSVDEEFFDDLEELLIESDVGYETALRISDELREEVKLRNAKKRSDVSDVIVEKLVDMYDEEGKEEDNALHFSQDDKPTVFLFVGVNGAGKTTTIGKLAHRFQSQGKKVLLAAGDTFRAGAIEQLQRWGERVNVPVEAKPAQTDPASVVYDALHRAIDEHYDILLVDTAGRLQNNQNLMRELEKIKRVISREIPEAPQEVLLVLDGSTGQNALSQAKQFKETTDVSGIVLTKLDGSSQGGIVLAIRNELHLPVKLVGLGEQMDDLRDFDAEKFIYGLFKDLIVGSGD
ncbi:signal recognition particle-docking protein FtsY [Companilactobacillus furfuricola]|uniref:signal recognition particle-docking protein FtsY n=1 Tax=Companilactobacillus furfuricola TaxID=1462575 RepID=UPI003CCC7A83